MKKKRIFSLWDSYLLVFFFVFFLIHPFLLPWYFSADANHIKSSQRSSLVHSFWSFIMHIWVKRIELVILRRCMKQKWSKWRILVISCKRFGGREWKMKRRFEIDVLVSYLGIRRWRLNADRHSKNVRLKRVNFYSLSIVRPNQLCPIFIGRWGRNLTFFPPYNGHVKSFHFPTLFS